MARVANAVINNASEGNFAFGGMPMVDVRTGGMNGLSPSYAGYVTNAAQIRRDVIPVVMETPAGFQDLPNPDIWVGTFKNIVELHSQTIEGLNSTLTAEFSETAIGGTDEVQQDVANVRRARSEPAHTYPEKYGYVIRSFHEGWMVNLMMHPTTKAPLVFLYADNPPADLLPDYRAATVLYIEPDPTNTKVACAWLCFNMMPQTAGEKIGGRDLTATNEAVVHTINYTAITQVGTEVDDLAQTILDGLNLTGANPNARQAVVQGVSPDVAAVENGFAKSVSDISN